MPNLLLAHMYSHIKGSAEDVATYSLEYLLNAYPALNNAFNNLVFSKIGLDSQDLSWSTQEIGEDKERPDMSGADAQGKERFLAEAKFYAGLTSNQPLTYLKRLKNEHGDGLIFICPEKRIVSLWPRLIDICKGQKVQRIDDWCYEIDGIRMSIVSWSELLNILFRAADTECRESSSDLSQLEGLCRQMDEESFTPLRSEELGKDNARIFEKLTYLLDATVDSILSDQSVNASTEGLRAAPYRHGYKRFLYINGLGFDLRFDLDFWKKPNKAETPYWVSVRTGDWKITDRITTGIKSAYPQTHIVFSYSVPYVAIEPVTCADEQDVIDNFKRKVYALLEIASCQTADNLESE